MKLLKKMLIVVVLLMTLQTWPHPRPMDGERICLLLGYNAADYYGDLSGQTKSRCDKAIEIYCNGIVNKIYITTAGMGHHMSVGEEMKEYMIENGVHHADIITCRGGYNTAGEIDSFLELVPYNTHVFAVSSYYHLFRIRMIFRSRGVICTTYGSNGGIPKSEMQVEIIKSIITIFFPYMFVERY